MCARRRSTVRAARVRRTSRRRTTHLPDRLAEGVTLVVGYRPEGFGAWIVDAAGNVLHRWDATFSQVFGERGAAAPVPGARHHDRLARHASLPERRHPVQLPGQQLPVRQRAGEARQGRQGRLEAGSQHPPRRHGRAGRHDLGPCAPLSPGRHAGRARPQAVVLRGRGAQGLAGRQGARRDLDPRRLRTASRHVRRSPMAPPPRWRRPILPHLNDVEPLPAAWAAQFPLFKAGDLLVSLRNMNMIAVIDPQTKLVKWQLSGLFVQQHDADFLPNGHLMVYDNQGGDPACGGTRILEIDPSPAERGVELRRLRREALLQPDPWRAGGAWRTAMC